MTDVLASADPGAPGAPTDPAAEPTQGVGTAVLEREELQSTDDGDADRFAHYVRKDKIAAAAVTGRPVVALCGKVLDARSRPVEVPGVPHLQVHLRGDAQWGRLRRQRPPIPPVPVRARRSVNAARGGQATHPTPTRASTSAAQNLSPAYPRRAAWGTAGSLRAWQAAALGQYLETMPQDFLAVATPGAGKTTFALRVATELLSSGDVHKVTIVCPTEHLKYQWAEAAARVGIHIDPSYSNSQGALGSRFDGVALTYAQVAANANLHRARTDQARTLVILDEIHHGGDALSWGARSVRPSLLRADGWP